MSGIPAPVAIPPETLPEVAPADLAKALARPGVGLLSGPTGSGKSTLLLGLAGLLPGIREPLLADPNCAAVVLQNPESQFLCTTVGEEVAFAPRQRGLPLEGRVEAALAATGTADLAPRSVDSLSMGQRARVLLAVALALEPRVLLLDELLAQLDPAAGAQVGRLLRELADGGLAVLVAEQPGADTAGLGDWGCRLTPRGVPPLPEPAGVPWPPARPARLRAGELHYGFAGGSLLEGVSLELTGGEVVTLSGANGCGKSTLLRLLAGDLVPDAGRVELEAAGPVERVGRLGLLLQNPDLHLFGETARREVQASVTAMAARGQPVAEADTVLRLLGLGGLADHAPFRLSAGQRRLLALAGVLAAGPSLLLLDEPYAGLDPTLAGGVERLLHHLAAEAGVGVLITTHAEAGRYRAHRQLRLAGGRLHELPH